jgi:CHASE2 domain-containing sensor protein
VDMLAPGRAAEIVRAVIRLSAYLSLFAFIAWRYRKNRMIVLGAAVVCVACVFASSRFFIAAHLFSDRVVASVLLLVLLTCLAVLGLAVIDVVRWARGRRTIEASPEDRSAVDTSRGR